MSNIKINDVPQRVQYTASAGQTQFTIPFPFFQNNYVYVWQDGVQIFPGAGAGQYAITGAGSPSGGLITLVSSATLGSIITIQGVMPIDRTSIYSATISNLTGSDLNGDFNREVVMMKQIETTQSILQLQYAPWAEVSQDPDVTIDRYLPLLEAGHVWVMNADRTAIISMQYESGGGGGGAPTDAKYILQQANISLPDAQALDVNATGVMFSIFGSGIVGTRILTGTDHQIDIANGSGASGNPTYSLSNTLNFPGSFTVQNTSIITQIINDPTMAGATTNNLSTSAALKSYIDSLVVGLNVQGSCVAATTVALTANYSNGAAGVGASLTNAGVQAAFEIDGVTPTLGERVLIKNQASTFQNGIYTVTDEGSGATNWILTRATGYDTASEINPGDFIIIIGGTTQAQSSWIQTDVVTTMGTSPIVFVQFTASLPMNVPSGGTGVTSFTAYAPIIGGTTTTGSLQSLTLGAAGTLYQSNGVGVLPGFTTAAFPSTAGTTGTILRSDGTDWVNSTATYPDTYAQGDLLYASATNVLAKLAKDATPTRYLSNTGTTNNPAWAQIDLSNGVTGNLGVAHLDGGTGASATTYWRGDGSWGTPAGGGSTAPTVQEFLSGSGTYTTPTSPAPIYIRVMAVGGGAGGNGGGNSAPGAGTAGGNTTFGGTVVVANGGATNGGAGGSASLGAGAIGFTVAGGCGTYLAAVVGGQGGAGGNSYFGGAGGGGVVTTQGNAPAANSGSGGGGGGGGVSGSSGGGGSAGGFADAIISSPSATYAFVIGAAGSGGTAGGGTAGTAGAAGRIIVYEYY